MGENTTSKAVILLEDEPDISDLLAQVVAAAGAEPIVCRDQPEVLAAAESQSVVLALLDIMLPAVDGRAVAVALRERKVGFPIYFMTGVKASHIGENYHAIADGVLFKPFSLQKLRDLLDRALGSVAATPAGDERRKIVELMAVIASEQEDIRRRQRQLAVLLSTGDSATGEMWREFSMSLEASLNRQATLLTEIRRMVECFS